MSKKRKKHQYDFEVKMKKTAEKIKQIQTLFIAIDETNKMARQNNKEWLQQDL